MRRDARVVMSCGPIVRGASQFQILIRHRASEAEVTALAYWPAHHECNAVWALPRFEALLEFSGGNLQVDLAFLGIDCDRVAVLTSASGPPT